MRFFSLVLSALVLALAGCRTIPTLPKDSQPTVDGYKKALEDQLGPIWYHAVSHEPNVTVGTVKVTFEIPARGGRVHNFKIVSNSAGFIDKKMVYDAVEWLRAPPIPEAVLKAAHADFVSFEESFTIYPNLEPSSSPAPKKR